jgi:hypothetical protein
VNLSTSSKITRVSNAVAAGTATTNCSAVDMKGFDAVTFVAAIGAIEATGTVTLKAQQSTDNSTFADLEGTAIAYTDADDNKLAVLEITKPRERYVRAVVTTATANGTIDGVIAIQTAANEEPTTNGSTVVGTEQHLAPAEGTA